MQQEYSKSGLLKYNLLTITSLLYLLAALGLSLASCGCGREAGVSVSGNESKRTSPPNFSLRYERGNGNLFEPLSRTTYELKDRNKLEVTFKYPNESRVVQKVLSDEQLDLLWQKISHVDLEAFAEPATELHERCHIRETDHPYSAKSWYTEDR